MRLIKMIAILGVGLLAPACPGPTGQGGGAQTGPGTGTGSDTSAALTAEQLEEVQQTVRNGQDAITHCYTDEMERQKNKKLTGNVLVKILVGTNQRAEQVVIGEHTLRGPQLHACITNTVKSWEFPKLNSPGWFTYPFEFSPAY